MTLKPLNNRAVIQLDSVNFRVRNNITIFLLDSSTLVHPGRGLGTRTRRSLPFSIGRLPSTGLVPRFPPSLAGLNHFKPSESENNFGTLRGNSENVITLALLKGLRLVHFFRGPLKELANAIRRRPGPGPGGGKMTEMMAIQTTKGVTVATHTP